MIKKEKININYIAISELSKELGVNKSKIHYYCKIGLLKPDATLSNVFLFNKEKTSKKLKEIQKHIKEGKKVKDLVKEKNENN